MKKELVLIIIAKEILLKFQNQTLQCCPLAHDKNSG